MARILDGGRGFDKQRPGDGGDKQRPGDGGDKQRPGDRRKELGDIRIISGAVEKISVDGSRTREGDQRLWDAIDRVIERFRQNSISIIMDGQPTTVVAVSAKECGLSSRSTVSSGREGFLKSLFKGKGEKNKVASSSETAARKEFKPDDMAIIFTFKVTDATSTHRDAQLFGIALVKYENLYPSLEEFINDPDNLFQLIEELNGGSSVTRYDGTAANIFKGKSIRFVLSGDAKLSLPRGAKVPSESNPFVG